MYDNIKRGISPACAYGESYGPNCNTKCRDRHCLSPAPPCDGERGSCGAGRCQAGWTGETCTQRELLDSLVKNDNSSVVFL